MIEFRRAKKSDLGAIADLLRDDVLGATREPLDATALAKREAAFEEIDRDPNQFLCIAMDGKVAVGTMQLIFIPGLSRGGAKRGQIEAVRISSNRRGEGLGKAMFLWAIDLCRQNGCEFVQLTTDKARLDAHRFYDRLGFEASHIGYKLVL